MNKIAEQMEETIGPLPQPLKPEKGRKTLSQKTKMTGCRKPTTTWINQPIIGQLFITSPFKPTTQPNPTQTKPPTYNPHRKGGGVKQQKK